jgi:hypothetical protein
MDLPEDLASHIGTLWANIDETKATLEVYELQLKAAVKKAQMLGCSWRAIGEALGVSAQAAHEHYRYNDTQPRLVDTMAD